MATLWENQSHISHQKYYQTCMDGVDLMSHKKKNNLIIWASKQKKYFHYINLKGIAHIDPILISK